MEFTRDQMLKAMRRNDAAYDGRFYICVKTTEIYCLPSCKAKLPFAKNVIFVETRDEALALGFRGCKRCKSETYPDVAPKWVGQVLDFMRGDLTSRLDEKSLAEIADVDITTIRRYFRTHFRTTPLAYHRKLRLARAGVLIAKGVDYLATACDCGFESASGFRTAFAKEFGLPPGRYYAKVADDTR